VYLGKHSHTNATIAMLSTGLRSSAPRLAQRWSPLRRFSAGGLGNSGNKALFDWTPPPARETHRKGWPMLREDGRAWPYVVTMPLLSPSMGEGKVTAWHVGGAGDECVEGELLCEIETSQLMEDERDNKPTRLLIESHDPGYVARIIVPVGATVSVNTPICIVCESEEDAEHFSSYEPTMFEGAPDGERLFNWQAYLASKEDEVGSCD